MGRDYLGRPAVITGVLMSERGRQDGQCRSWDVRKTGPAQLALKMEGHEPRNAGDF